ncbi:MAG: efflux transporter periplasmic adaptor subunit, partial [Pseudomonadota bacterium]
PDAALPAAGSLGHLNLARQIDERGVWVPLAALTEGQRGLWSLYVVENGEASPEMGRVVRRQVEVVTFSATDAFVRGLISPGDKIVTTGTHRIVPDQLVALNSN